MNGEPSSGFGQQLQFMLSYFIARRSGLGFPAAYSIKHTKFNRSLSMMEKEDITSDLDHLY